MGDSAERPNEGSGDWSIFVSYGFQLPIYCKIKKIHTSNCLGAYNTIVFTFSFYLIDNNLYR